MGDANLTGHASPPDSRSIVARYRGVPASDGAGVRLTRVIGSPQLNMLDPFLLLDVFETENPDDYIAGFPAHPHRGFETVTYLIAGRMRHEDSAGNAGIIQTGGAQWMTAGRGIVHSEMPEQADGLMKGIQLWINLPARLKSVAPGYRDVSAADIPQDMRDGLTVRVLAGRTDAGTVGPLTAAATDPFFSDVSIETGAEFSQSLPPDHAAFIYALEGEITDANDATAVTRGQLAVLSAGHRVRIKGASPRARFLLIAGKALEEPVARGGPFVMNTREEIQQAFNDYASGKLVAESKVSQE